MINFSHYQLPPEKVEQLLDIVKQALSDFALFAWGSQDNWILALEPKYINSEANSYYPWLGVVSQKGFRGDNEIITADDRYCVTLEALRFFRIVAFRDYGYRIIGTSISYLCVTEISHKTEATAKDLQLGIQKVYEYLKQSPVKIIMEGHEHLTNVYTRTEIGPSIELRTRVLNKHS